MNEITKEFIEKASEWWSNLSDDKQSEFIQELYAREHNIKIE